MIFDLASCVPPRRRTPAEEDVRGHGAGSAARQSDGCGDPINCGTCAAGRRAAAAAAGVCGAPDGGACTRVTSCSARQGSAVSSATAAAASRLLQPCPAGTDVRRRRRGRSVRRHRGRFLRAGELRGGGGLVRTGRRWMRQRHPVRRLRPGADVRRRRTVRDLRHAGRRHRLRARDVHRVAHRMRSGRRRLRRTASVRHLPRGADVRRRWRTGPVRRWRMHAVHVRRPSVQLRAHRRRLRKHHPVRHVHRDADVRRRRPSGSLRILR